MNMLFADKNLNPWRPPLTENLNYFVNGWMQIKLALNVKKSNYVIFRPRQKKLNYNITLMETDNSTNGYTPLECKDYVKYLGVLIDNHLSWEHHIDYIASKLINVIGVIARLRHFVPFHTLHSIYQSLMFPYLSYGLVVWGQAPQSDLNKILLLQKRALHIMHFSNPRAHVVPLLVSAKILPLNLRYFNTVSNPMYDISKNSAPENICNNFIRCSSIHSHSNRASTSENFYIKYSPTNQLSNSIALFGANWV